MRNELPEMITTVQAAKLLGLSRPAITRLVQTGQLPAYRYGTAYRLERDDVLNFKEKSRITMDH